MRVLHWVVLSWLLAPRALGANPLDMYGFGSRSTALGSAVSADVGDFSANYYNPAGLSRARGVSLEIGYFYASPRLTTDGRDNNVDPAHGLVGGMVVPGRLFRLPFAFGLGFHLPDERLSRVRALPPSEPRWELYDVRLQRLFIAANVSISPWPWLRLGAGLAFMASTRGRIEIAGDLSVANPETSALGHTVDADLTSVRYPQFGAQVDLGRGFTASAVYRDRFNLDLALDASLSGRIHLGGLRDRYSPVIPGFYGLSSRTLSGFQPRQVVLGLAWVPAARWHLMADFTFAQWSEYENPAASTEVQLELRVPAGIPGLRQPTVPTPARRDPVNFHDTLIAALGVEHRVPLGRHRAALRAGYRFDPSPVPDQSGESNYIDASRHVLSLGAGITLSHLGSVVPGSLGLDAHLSMHYLPRRSVLKVDPADPIGDYIASGTVLNLGLSARVSFD